MAKNVKRTSQDRDMQSYYSQGDEFHKLQQEWYAKLAATGFEDLELGRDAHDTMMRRHHLSDRRTALRAVEVGNDQETAAVKELAGHSGHSTLRSRLVMALAAAGLGPSAIAEGLPKRAGVSLAMVKRITHAVRQAAATVARDLLHKDDV